MNLLYGGAAPPAFAHVNEVHSTCQQTYVQPECTRNFINHWMMMMFGCWHFAVFIIIIEN